MHETPVPDNDVCHWLLNNVGMHVVTRAHHVELERVCKRFTLYRRLGQRSSRRMDGP